MYLCLSVVNLSFPLSLLYSISSSLCPLLFFPVLPSPLLSCLSISFFLSLLYLISSSLCPLLSFPVFPLLYILSCLSLFLSLLCSISSSLCPLISSPSLSFSLLSFLSTTHPSIERCMRQTPQHITVKMMFNDATSYHIILLWFVLPSFLNRDWDWRCQSANSGGGEHNECFKLSYYSMTSCHHLPSIILLSVCFCTSCLSLGQVSCAACHAVGLHECRESSVLLNEIIRRSMNVIGFHFNSFLFIVDAVGRSAVYVNGLWSLDRRRRCPSPRASRSSRWHR